MTSRARWATAHTHPAFSFPLPEAPEQKPDSLYAAPKETKSKRSLCVDDEPGIRDLLSESLAHIQHQVTLAASGLALELFRDSVRDQKPYQAVITDLGMPEMDGRQLTHKIKVQSPLTPVIMMTGWGTMMKDDREPTPEVDALVCKPPRLDELNSLLLRLCSS